VTSVKNGYLLLWRQLDVYNAGCIPTRKSQGISMVREKPGKVRNFIIGQGIFIVFIIILLKKFISALIFYCKNKNIGYCIHKILKLVG
jgi:hypothetical protein